MRQKFLKDKFFSNSTYFEDGEEEGGSDGFVSFGG